MEKEKLIEIHQEARKSLIDFYRIILSDDEYCDPADFHWRLSDILLEDTKHFAIEAFRESAKSSYVLKSFPLHRLVYPKEKQRYIVLIKANQELASAKLQEIADEYLSNPVLNFNLKEVRKNSAKVFEVTVFDPEPITIRIEAYGKGSSIRGLSWGNLRPQIILCDDIQDLEDSESDAVQRKDWNWFLSDIMFLAKTGRIFLIGNNLGEKCILERIMNDTNLDFEKMRISAIAEGKSTWPSKFTLEELEREKMQYTSLGKLDIWYRERMCQAISDEMRDFKKEYFKYWSFDDFQFREQNNIGNLDYYIAVDLAISQKEKADDTVVCVVGKEQHSPNWYIMDFIGGKLDPLQTIDAIFTLYEKYRPLKVGIESVAYQKALLYFVQEEQRKRGVYFNVDEIKTSQKKEDKIRGLQPMYKAGVIFHPPVMSDNPLLSKHVLKLEEQLMAFPLGLHDDYPDVLSMFKELIENTTNKPKKNNHRSGYIDPVKRINNAYQRARSYRDPMKV